MDIHPEVIDYIKTSVDNSIGLPVDVETLESKLRAAEEAQMRYREQYLKLGFRMKEKDAIIERTRAEASMNAHALKKFVEENRKLAEECGNLANQCAKWENECSLYDRDREMLMEFGNEADERAKNAESRLIKLEEELGRAVDELQLIKARDSHEVNSLSDVIEAETLLVSAIETVLSKDEIGTRAQVFLETNIKHESFNKLREMWNQLKPSTQMVISLIAETKRLEKDKEHLRKNLHRAEDEAKLLSEENNFLDEENGRLLKQLKKIRHSASGGKQSCSSTTKGQKRKSNPIDKLDFSDAELGRCPLSPLLHNSPDTKMHKK